MYGREPDLTREGGSIPVTLTFAESLGVNVLLLPMGRGDDGAQYVNVIFLGIVDIGSSTVPVVRQTRSSTAPTSSRV